MVLRPLPPALALVALSASSGRTSKLPPEPEHTLELNQIRCRRGALSEVELSRAETVKLEAEQADDSAVEALRQAEVQLAFLFGQRRALTDFAVDPGPPSASSNAVFQIEAATAMELAQ